MRKINLQMYSFLEMPKPYDNEAAFKAAAEMGYDGVELFGPNLGMDPLQLKDLLESLGLEALSMHAPSTDLVEAMLPFAGVLKLPFIGIGMEMLPDEASVHAFAERLNEIGEKCRAQGITLLYHNHTQEFAPCGEQRIIDVLMKETDPEKVGFELDAGWCAAAGFDPINEIRTYAGRFKLVHIKESDSVIGPLPPMDFNAIPKDEHGAPLFTKEQLEELDRNRRLNCAAGAGLVDWKQLAEAADACGCRGYIVEREYTPEAFASREAVLAADVKYYKEVM